VRELEKGGARTVWESERLRHHEMLFAGDVEGSISGAREDVYAHPGAKPEYRFGGIMEDLRRRDFAINAIAISLNAQSRGLLLDPTNGLADLERQEVRALSNHAFTNQPLRLLRILRYCARMGFKMESRTQEWFDLAMERKLNENIDTAGVGEEIRSLGREDYPATALKLWEEHGLLVTIHLQLQRRKPDYDSLNKVSRLRSNLYAAGIRPRLREVVEYYIFGRLKDREASAAMRNLEFRPAEVDAIAKLVPEAKKIVHVLKSRKMNAARDAYHYISSLPSEMLAFIEVEMPSPGVLSKIRSYLQKWRPLRLSLPLNELDVLGIPRGPQFDKIMEQLFDAQLRGRGRDPEERAKMLRNFAGIKDESKKKPEKEKKQKGKEPEEKGVRPAAEKTGPSAAAAIGSKAKKKHEEAEAAGKKEKTTKSKASGKRKK